MPNLFLELQELLKPGRTQIGTVVAYVNGVATVEFPGAGQARAKGQATVGGKVFVLDGVIQGPAPDLPLYVDVI